MDVSESKGKPNWKLWDELMIGAWEKDASISLTINHFFMALGVEYPTSIPGQPDKWRQNVMEVFTTHGVTSRSPKSWIQFKLSVRVLFHQFFPKVNDLLWDSKRNEALTALRKYKLTESDRYRQDDETRKVIDNFSARKSLTDLPTIDGTNAVHVRNSRRTKSDWNTVKPSRARSR